MLTQMTFYLSLQDFVLEHYSEDSDAYSDEIQEFSDLRQVCVLLQETKILMCRQIHIMFISTCPRNNKSDVKICNPCVKRNEN